MGDVSVVKLIFTDDKSTFVLVMAWCHQATTHYLSQCWPRSMCMAWPGHCELMYFKGVKQGNKESSSSSRLLFPEDKPISFGLLAQPYQLAILPVVRPVHCNCQRPLKNSLKNSHQSHELTVHCSSTRKHWTCRYSQFILRLANHMSYDSGWAPLIKWFNFNPSMDK